MDPKQAEKYFKPTSIKLGAILIGIGVLFLLIGMNGSAGSFMVGLVLAGVGGWLIYSQTQGRPTDEQIDAEINRVGGTAMERGLNRLGLDEEQVGLIQPVVIPGPDVRNAKGKIRRGKDGQIRSAANKVLVLYFSENEVHSYTHQFDITDPSVKRESTDEYFYRDIVSVSTLTDPEKISLADGTTVEVNWDYFRLTTSGGTSISVAAYNGGELASSIQGMRSLLKQKKMA